MAGSFRNHVDTLVRKYVDAYNGQDPAACAQVYSEDAIVLLPGAILRGREAIATDFQTLFKSGLRVTGLTTTHCQSDGNIGYAVQIEHSERAIRIHCWCFDKIRMALGQFVLKQSSEIPNGMPALNEWWLTRANRLSSGPLPTWRYLVGVAMG